MQAAARRLPAAARHRQTDNTTGKPSPGMDGDTGLLGALPIAAAIVERVADGLKVSAHNDRFFETVSQSTCTASDWNEADCLKSGPIAELINRFFDGADPKGELDFKDGEGVACRYFRVKLAPLTKKK